MGGFLILAIAFHGIKFKKSVLSVTSRVTKLKTAKSVRT
jgi:hypothetical protein